MLFQRKVRILPMLHTAMKALDCQGAILKPYAEARVIKVLRTLFHLKVLFLRTLLYLT